MSNQQIQQKLLNWISERLAEVGRPIVLGVAGGQGVGKSYLTHGLLKENFPHCVVLSLDDYYLPKADREGLAARIHPMLATRGVPGTHDLDLLIAHISKLRAGNGDKIEVPRFDKLLDDRVGYEALQNLSPPLIIVEGWCVGAAPQPASDLAAPVNGLEQQLDPDGAWRTFVNAQLDEMHRKLSVLFDATMFLKPDSFRSVRGWRIEQERSNYAAQGKTMPAFRIDEIEDFIQYYQRISQHMIENYAHFDFVVEVSGADREWKCLTPDALNS
ncbi:hypothetical protein [Maritalea sp.]|uniref:hypothetical protein n=1 Tax=Maritalea sp. TaxID=2003361 RepID=UPI003EF8D772